MSQESNIKEKLNSIQIRKKNGSLQKYEAEKLLNAVGESAKRARPSGFLTDIEKAKFIELIEKDIVSYAALNNISVIPTATLHIFVEKNLPEVAPDVGKAYKDYHSERMAQAKSFEKLLGRCATLVSSSKEDSVMAEKNQNANADSTLCSTIKSFFGDYIGEEYLKTYVLTDLEKQLSEDGYIYFHDKNGLSIYPNNCCLFNMAYVLEHGYEINGVKITQPKSLDVCFDLIGDTALMAASQQYGGFTIPEIDFITEPYAEMSYEMYLAKYLSMGVDNHIAEVQAYEDVKKDMYAGWQGLEIKFNTVASSRGDYPFITATFGLNTSRWGKLCSLAALETRRIGQGEKGKKKPVLFPKLVFLYDKNLHGKGKIAEDIFEAGLVCSSQTMYPDWLSLTGEGYVPEMYKKYGLAISPMGCRAFLSAWYERGGIHPADENDKPVFIGRFNIGVVSMNLPMYLAQARELNKDFYEVLDYYLEIIRKHFKSRYSMLSHMKASRNPIAFQYGGYYGGNLNPEDNIEPVLRHSTASFGITALNELQRLYNGKSLYEDGEFALEVLKHINDKVNQFKEEDNYLYAIYGTPAEKLCGLQVKQFREKYGIIENVSDREYVSNSFHCHVTEDISPIQKQDSERRFWNYCNGGKIQYCKYSIGYNIDAIRSIILRAMEIGFYEGVNLSLDFCDDCGHREIEMGVRCPKCGSIHITQIDRMNGYLGFTRVGKDTVIEYDENGNEVIVNHTRYSPHKLIEIRERKSM